MTPKRLEPRPSDPLEAFLLLPCGEVRDGFGSVESH